jgi:sucrose-6-phosphatase
MRIFVTDLDHTLVNHTIVGKDEALEKLNLELSKRRNRNETKIVYSTGRSLTLYKQLAAEKKLLNPDALITSVGTEIYFDSSYETPDPEWSEILKRGWNRDDVAEIINTNFEKEITNRELKFQPKSEQGLFKVSCFLKEETAERLLPKLNDLLENKNIKFKLIYSGSKDLDVLPENADKGSAVKYLQEKWNVSADEKTVVCGDSGNDISLFSLGGERVRGIIVGNALPELCEWYNNNKSDYIYYAKSSCAEGILEGLTYHLNLKFI